MWSQYGDEYRGVCLVFERDQLDANISTEIVEPGLNLYSDRVNYENPSIVPDFRRAHSLVVNVDEIEIKGMKSTVDHHLQSHRKELFFTKALDWKEEREFRWLVTGCKQADFSASIGSSLVGVLLGDKFPGESKGVVANYAQKLGFSVAELSWRNGVPQPMPVPNRVLMQESSRKVQMNEVPRTSFLKQWWLRFWKFLHL